MRSAAVLLKLTDVVVVCYAGGPGLACSTLAGDVPSNLKVGANCGGACNMIGNCAAGLTCETPPPMGGGMGLPIRGGGTMGGMMPQQIGTCTAAAAVDGGRNCAGCDEAEGGGDADGDGVVDVYDQQTIAAATAAVGMIDAQSNSMNGNQFIDIVPGSVDEQIVSGTRYNMDIDVGVTACRNTGTTLDATKCPATAGGAVQRYHIDIVFVPWQTPQMNLIAFHPIASTPTAAVAHKATGTSIAGQAQGPRLGAGGSCGDGTQRMCMVMMMCPTGTVEATMNECTSCVDPTTCLASNGH